MLIIAGGNYFITGWFIRYAKVKRITDVPSERSSHSTPTPRGGGIGFVVSSLATFLIYFAWNDLLTTTVSTAILISLTLIAILGWVDDRKDLSSLTRFTIHLIAAILVVLFVGSLESFYFPFLSMQSLGIAGIFLTLLWITGVTNIYNFMDGVDGIASVQALSASAGWMLIGYLWGEPVIFTVNLVVFGTVSAFLIYNWSPARIFMGDVGSVFLGFFFAIMPFLASKISVQHSMATTLWIGAFLLWPFLFDGSITIFRRILNRENIFEAHRTHLYQRLYISGWSHSRISSLYLLFSAACIPLAVSFPNSESLTQLKMILGLLVVSFLYVTAVNYIEKDSD